MAEGTTDFTAEFTTGNSSFTKTVLWKETIIAILLFLLVVVTMAGNVIVLLAFVIEKKLRNTFTCFIANLAVTDFLVGFVAMMFYSFDTVLGYWPFGEFMCGLWIFFDYAMTFASVFTLVAISIDRYWAVTWSLHYRTHNNRRKALIILALVWGLVLIIWLPPCILDRVKWSESQVCWWDPSKNTEFVYFIAIAGHHVPCIVIIYCYICVFYLTRQRLKVRPGEKPGGRLRPGPASTSTTCASLQPGPSTSGAHSIENTETISIQDNTHSTSAMGRGSAVNGTSLKRKPKEQSADNPEDGGNKEKKIFVTLSYILITYLICWLPFHIIFDFSFIAPNLVPANVYTFGFWLAYFNSTLNPIIYAYSNKEFRKAFRRVITCKWR